MSSCTDPLGCERAHQAVVLARQAALKLMDGVAQLRIAKVGSEAILERLDELRTLPPTPDGSPHPRAVQITQFVRRAIDRLDSHLDDAYCETHALIYQLDSTIGQWELEELEPAQH